MPRRGVAGRISSLASKLPGASWLSRMQSRRPPGLAMQVFDIGLRLADPG